MNYNWHIYKEEIIRTTKTISHHFEFLKEHELEPEHFMT